MKKLLFLLFCVSIIICPVWAANAQVTQTAVIATVAADWTSGAHSIISVDPVDGTRPVQNNLNPTGSDLTVASYGIHFFMIERFGANNITKFNINEPSTPIWQFSTEGDETNSNPYELIFKSDKKAYLLRYGSYNAWIVNPSATTEEAFKIGELDLSAYEDVDGVPNMSSAVIVGNKLFITLQRADITVWPIVHDDTFVAVFDTTTDTEVDTRKNANVLKGIPLPIKNPQSIQHVEDSRLIYVQGVGDWDPSTTDVKGGIVKIDSISYEVTTVLEDHSDYGSISGMSIISATKGYFIGYAGWGDNTLYSFDPSCGCNITAISGLENINISPLQSQLILDKNNRLWISNQTNATVDILDTLTDTIDESVSTELNPQKVVFCAEGSPESTENSNSDTCFISTLCKF